MQFLTPIALVALTGLLVPLVIHLWHVKQGKVLKIGSIALLGTSAKATSRNFKINDWLLFILRCLLLITLCLLVAQPYFLQNRDPKINGGWILVKQNQLRNAYKAHQKTFDSLIQIGYEIRDFNLGFTALSLNDTAANAPISHAQVNYTSLLQALNQFLPQNYKAYLFADQRIDQLGHDLPNIAYKLQWVKFSNNDTLAHWFSEYAGKKYEGSSSPSFTSFRAITDENTLPIKVNIAESSYTPDRNYLIAALKAIADYSRRKLQINPPNGKATIGFWLSEKPVTSAFSQSIAENGTLFKYENGKVLDNHTIINVNEQNFNLRKRIINKSGSENICTDGYGNAILTREKSKGRHIYRFYSRLNPAWNDMVWSQTFVEVMMPILIDDNNLYTFGFKDHPKDQRTIALSEQLKPSKQTGENELRNHEIKLLDTQLWILACLLLIIERILSFRQTKYAKS